MARCMRNCDRFVMTVCLSADGVPSGQEVGLTSGQHDVMKTNEPRFYRPVRVCVCVCRLAEPVVKSVVNTEYDCLSLSWLTVTLNRGKVTERKDGRVLQTR